MTLWLSRLPSWGSLALLLLLANGAALAAMQMVRAWHRRTGVSSGPAVVNAWATCAGALAALLFAFSIVTLWNQGVRAHTTLDDEISAIRAIGRDIAPAQRALLGRYVSATIAEWPQLCGGSPGPAARGALTRLERTAEPRKIEYRDNLYRALGTLEDDYNLRWQVAEGSVPVEIWIALVVLALALLVVLAVAMPDRAGTHATLMLAVGTALGTLFWVTIVLEYPFCRWHGIGPHELRMMAQVHGF